MFGRATNLRLQKRWKRKRKSPGEINVERIGQDRYVPCRRGFIRSLGFSCLRRNAPFEAATAWDPARQTETCEYEPCVNLALRSRNKVKFRSNIVSIGVRVPVQVVSFFLFLSFFFIFTFFRNGQGQNLLPQTGMPVFWQTRNLRTVPK